MLYRIFLRFTAVILVAALEWGGLPEWPGRGILTQVAIIWFIVAPILELLRRPLPPQERYVPIDARPRPRVTRGGGGGFVSCVGLGLAWRPDEMTTGLQDENLFETSDSLTTTIGSSWMDDSAIDTTATTIDPASGLPMVGGTTAGFDIAGNVYGTSHDKFPTIPAA